MKKKDGEEEEKDGGEEEINVDDLLGENVPKTLRRRKKRSEKGKQMIEDETPDSLEDALGTAQEEVSYLEEKVEEKESEISLLKKQVYSLTEQKKRSTVQLQSYEDDIRFYKGRIQTDELNNKDRERKFDAELKKYQETIDKLQKQLDDESEEKKTIYETSKKSSKRSWTIKFTNRRIWKRTKIK